MAAVNVLRSLQALQRRPTPGMTLPSFVGPITGPEVQPDGTELFTTSLIPVPGSDLSIPLGTWTLLLLPINAGTAQIPVRMFFNGPDQPNPGEFHRIEADLSRFELISDPRDLVPADLVADPYVHLVENRALGPVRLLGPGLTLILRGEGLTDVSAEFVGANGGYDERFPSARFSPPHFLIGASDNFVGVACDEVMLDLSTEIDPDNLADLTGTPSDGTFEGLIMQEVGIFIGDPNEVGTWSGMLRAHNFVLQFDPVELTGTFEGELVHAVAPDSPQVEIVVSWITDSGQRLNWNDVDPTIPAPIPPETARRVRLVANPNWASVGFQATWRVPETVQVEDPERINKPDLGWVRVPPGDHTFTIDVTDHRVDPVMESRTVLVQGPSDTEPPKPLEIDLVASVVEPATGSSALRLYVPLRPLQPIGLKLDAKGGVGDTLNASLEIPEGWRVAEPQTQNAARLDSGEFQRLTWTVTTDESPSEGSITVTAMLGSETVTRRLRYTLRAEPQPGSQDLRLIAQTDWRTQPGVAPAISIALDGLAYESVVYHLASTEAPFDLLSAEAHDDLLAADNPAFLNDQVIQPPRSGGVVKPELMESDRLYRLVAEVPESEMQLFTLIVLPETIIVERDETCHPIKTRPAKMTEALARPMVRNLFESKPFKFFKSNDSPAGPIRFAYDSFLVPPTDFDPSHPEREDCGATQSSLTMEQAQGFADIFHALDEAPDRIKKIGLFASASVEGEEPYNERLSENRLASALNELKNPSDDLRRAIAELHADHIVDDDLISRSSALIRDLDAAGKIYSEAWGEKYPMAGPTATDKYKLPFDRRVFAVIQLQSLPTDGFSRRTYFLVRAGAPPYNPDRKEGLPRPEEHPFRHSIFRSVHTELELRRNELLRFQFRLELDLERFDENDLEPPDELNPSDGIVTGFLELRRNPDPAASPRFAWELDLLADPTDVDGLLTFIKGGTLSPIVENFGGPLIAMPAMAAAAGGRAGPSSLLVAIGLGIFLQQAGWFDVQTVIWRGLRLRLQHGGFRPSRFSIALDYSVKYDIDVHIPGVGRLVTTSPIEITFRNVGVEIIGSFYGAVLFYDPASGFAIDVGDPGVFHLGSGLGRLLRPSRVTLGDASPLWLEVELSFALDTGVFSLDTLRIRVSLEGDTIFQPDGPDLDDLRVTINKVGVRVDVPGIIKGSGGLGIEEAVVEGNLVLDFEALPVLRGLEGRLRLLTRDDLRALYLALDIEFSPGLALGSTGLAVYGLHGLLGSNMAPANPEPLNWLRDPPRGTVTSEAKWAAERGAWAFGAGATFGTVFDNGYSFNLNGTLLLLLPGPRFVLAAHANVLSPKPDIGELGGVLATVTLDLENDFITAGFDLTVKIDGLLELRVPTEAFFDLTDAANFYVRFGQWVPESKRITMRLFELFDAWGYLQIEGRGLDNGAQKFDGFAVAAGARIEITWGTRHVLYLEAFAEVHAGIQLSPLYFEGGFRVGGSLHVGPVSIGASGDLRAKVRVRDPHFLILEGKVCGSIDLWFTKITKCIPFEVGDGDRPTPRPDNPFTEVVAIDRLTGLPIEEADGEVIVPIDAVFHATFTSDIRDRRMPPGISFAVDPSIFRNQVSDKLFYEFDLTSLGLRPVEGTDLTGVTSAWAPYTLVEASSAPPSQRTLRVMDWKPTAHPGRQVYFGSAVESALEEMISNLCDPIVVPPRQCVDFDEEPLGRRIVWVLDHGELPSVRVIGPSSSLGGNGFAEHPRVVDLVEANYPGRRPRIHCLYLGKPIRDQHLPFNKLIDLLILDADPTQVTGKVERLLDSVDNVISGRPIPQDLRALHEEGVIIIRLPSLVAVDAVFVVHIDKDPHDLGFLTLLDADLNTLTGPIPFSALEFVPDGQVGGSVAGHSIRRFSFGYSLLPQTGREPPTAQWLVLRPPVPSRATSQDGRNYRNYGCYLLELCGVTLTAWREFSRTHESVQETINTLTELSGLIAGEPVLLDQPLLVPGTRYELVGTMDWARYRSRDDAEPDGTSAGEGGSLPIQSRHFVADPQSPRDLTRHIRDHDPFDQDQPHYTDEPLLLRYTSAAIDSIYSAYGEQLVIRAKSDAQGHVVVQPTAATAGTTFVPVGPVEEELLRSLQAIAGRCLPGVWVNMFPRTQHTVEGHLLMPNNTYTVSVLARPQSEPGQLTETEWLEILEKAFDASAYVYRFDLRTSRWSSFADHVEVYREAPVGDLFVEDVDTLSADLAGLPIGRLLRNDHNVDTICSAVAGGPMIIPDRPEVLRLWVPNGPGWDCVGLLLDGPEPLLRNRLRLDGGIEDRITIVGARSTTSPAIPFDMGSPMAGMRIVAGARGARVFVLFEPPESTDRTTVVIRLHDRGPSTQTSSGADHDLAVEIGAAPPVIVEVKT